MIVTVAALVAIGIATLVPGSERGTGPMFGCVVCGDRGVADAIVNVILFAPLGIGLATGSVRVRHALLAGALVSGLVEFAQIAIIPGRDASVGDLLFDTLGTWLGYGLALLVPVLARLDDRTAGRLSIAAALDVALAVALTGWLLQPVFPRTAYWGQWTPPHFEWYRGHVVTARIAGREVRSRRIEDSEWARRALVRGNPIEVEFVAGPPVPGLASLFSIYDENRQEIFLVGPDRDDLVLRYRTRATAFRLDQPDLRMVGGWPEPLVLNAPYEVRIWSPTRGEWCMRGPAGERCDLGFSVGAGWGILFYAEWFPPWLRRLLAAGWTAALVLPLGVLLRRRWESVAALVVVATALAVLPTVVALRPTLGIEWLGAVLGVAGAAVAVRHARAWPH